MCYTYQLREDRAYDEKGKEWTVYGIEAIDTDGRILACFADVFFNQAMAVAFVHACNTQNVELWQLREVVEDALTEQYIRTESPSYSRFCE